MNDIPMPTVEGAEPLTVANAPIVELRPYSPGSWEEIKPQWTELVRASPYASFFLSADWIGCWLHVFGQVLKPEILLLRNDARLVGACLIVNRTRWYGPIPVRRIFLNAAGEDPSEQTYVEYNNILCAPGYETIMATTLSSYLRKSAWSEVCLQGFIEGLPLTALRSQLSAAETLTSRVPSYYVDLNTVRREYAAFESSLPSKARKEFRQNLRRYGSWGEVRLENASTPVQALAMLAELAELNRQHWRSRGGSSSFESPRFQQFHERLITTAFSTGAIQFVKVSAGDQVIGVLYNLINGGRVHFYQSGLYYGSDKRLRPGFTTLILTIQHCLDHGFEEFDLMAGDQFYKREFTEAYREMVWTTVRRSRSILPMLDRAAALKRSGSLLWKKLRRSTNKG